MAVETHTERAVFLDADDFAKSATFADVSSGTSSTVKGIFDKESVEQSVGEAGLIDEVPVFACRSSDVSDATFNDTFVIDTGPDFRQQMLRENVQNLTAVIYTHEHKDHLGGMDDVRAFNFMLKKDINLYATERVQKALKNDFHYAFADFKYPGVPLVNLVTIDSKPFVINSTKFIPIEVVHHKLPVLGFRIKDFAYITDANYIMKHITVSPDQPAPHLPRCGWVQGGEG